MKTIIYKNGIKQIVNSKAANLIGKHIGNTDNEFLNIKDDSGNLYCLIKIAEILYIE